MLLITEGARWCHILLFVGIRYLFLSVEAKANKRRGKN